MYLPVEQSARQKSHGAVDEVISDDKSISRVGVDQRSLLCHLELTKRRRCEILTVNAVCFAA